MKRLAISTLRLFNAFSFLSFKTAEENRLKQPIVLEFTVAHGCLSKINFIKEYAVGTDFRSGVPYRITWRFIAFSLILLLDIYIDQESMIYCKLHWICLEFR